MKNSLKKEEQKVQYYPPLSDIQSANSNYQPQNNNPAIPDAAVDYAK